MARGTTGKDILFGLYGLSKRSANATARFATRQATSEARGRGVGRLAFTAAGPHRAARSTFQRNYYSLFN